MPGTKAGGRKAAKTMKDKYGKDFYKTIGAIGGGTPTSTPKGFASMPRDRLHEIAKKGGRSSGGSK